MSIERRYSSMLSVELKQCLVILEVANENERPSGRKISVVPNIGAGVGRGLIRRGG